MDQLRKLFLGLTTMQRVTILLAALGAGAAIMAFVHLHHEGNFRPLYTSMAPEDAATVVQKLKETGVEYRLAENGSAVLVPTANLDESRLALAAAGLPKTGRIGFELFDKTNFGATEFVEHINYKRALEGELERSIMSLADVEQARVHITLPKESVFLDQQQPSKASVMLKLRPGAAVSPQNVLALTNLVASAVEGLSPDSVAVVDMDGNLLNRPKKAAAADGSEITSETLEVRQQLERNLVAKINQTLEPLLGANGFRAGASVECDLTSAEQQEETFDPTHSVMASSQKTEDASQHATMGGIPGTTSNLPPAGNTGQTKGSEGLSRRTENITYQTSRMVRNTRIPRGVVRRISLAVLVGQTVQWDGDGAQKRRVLVPPAPETLKTIRDLVAGVTGFSSERGDQLIVETLPFEWTLNQPPPAAKPVAPKPPAKGPAWLEWLNQYRDLFVPVIALCAVLLVLSRVLLGVRRQPRIEPELPETVELQAAPAVPALAVAKPQRLAASEAPPDAATLLAERVTQTARRDATVTANVLRMWLQENQTSS